MNAFEVLNNLYDLQEEYPHGRCYIPHIYNKVGIFDWFKDYLSKKDIQDMINFVEKARLLGFEGAVSFKVGAKYCANGMWAHELPTTEDGYDPREGKCLYRSFTPDRVCWDARDDEGTWMHEVYEAEEYKSFPKLLKKMEERGIVV